MIVQNSGGNGLKKREGHNGIYLLPNLFTTTSLFFAFYAIISAFKGEFESAVVGIFVGMVADGLDGRIARLTNTQSLFGAEYDSLSDMVTFGVAPALLLYCWQFQHLGKLGWLISFLYTACVAIRLARFNTQLETADKRYFQGLSCTASAGVVASCVWVCIQYQLSERVSAIAMGAMAVILSTLMVSNVRYYSFKEIDFKAKVSFLYVLIILILFIAIAANPWLVTSITFLAYAASGPLQTILGKHRLRKKRKRQLKVVKN